MNDAGKTASPVCFCLIYGVNDAGYFHRIGECPCNDFSCVQVHDACQVDKAFMGPDISNVCAPDGVRGFRVELFIKDVVKAAAEIGISCGGSPWLDPLGSDTHLFHVKPDSPLSDTDAGFAEFSGDFRGAVVLVGLVINLSDQLFDRFPALTRDRYCPVKESMVAGT